MDNLSNRQAAIEYFKRIIDATNTDSRYNLGFIDGLEFCINHLSTMPSIQSERKKGKWIPVRLGDCKCSLCGETYGIIGSLLSSYNYCPNCGAEMET